ncbi:MAG: hypothetical protein LBE50_03090 [Gallionellaceae bacterium]|jgi:hypothetical protein|nr:hypothetical protein [Gallionellaceae bacterium]
MHRIDGPGHINNLFVHENPATNQPPTEVTDRWLNAVQEEIVHVIEEAEMTLDVNDNTQLWQALVATFAKVGDVPNGEDFVQKEGDEMQGPLTLHDDAEEPLEAVPLRQVEKMIAEIDLPENNGLTAEEAQAGAYRAAVASAALWDGVSTLIVANFTPAVTVQNLTEGMVLFVQLVQKNFLHPLDFAPDGNIVQGLPIFLEGGFPLSEGDVALNQWLMLQYDPAIRGTGFPLSPGWILKNPIRLGNNNLRNQKFTEFTTTGIAPAFDGSFDGNGLLYIVPPLVVNQRLRVKFHAPVTSGQATLNRDSTGAKNLVQYNASGVKIPAVIAAGMLADVEYDGTDYVVLDPLPPLVESGNIDAPDNWAAIRCNQSGFSQDNRTFGAIYTNTTFDLMHVQIFHGPGTGGSLANDENRYIYAQLIGAYADGGVVARTAAASGYIRGVTGNESSAYGGISFSVPPGMSYQVVAVSSLATPVSAFSWTEFLNGLGSKVITATGNFVVPSGATSLTIKTLGAGGKGISFDSLNQGDIGEYGGNGGYTEITLTGSALTAVKGTTLACVVATGDGSGTTSVTGTGVNLVANNGGDATADVQGETVSPGAPGIASGGTTNTTGGGSAGGIPPGSPSQGDDQLYYSNGNPGVVIFTWTL